MPECHLCYLGLVKALADLSVELGIERFTHAANDGRTAEATEAIAHRLDRKFRDAVAELDPEHRHYRPSGPIRTHWGTLR